MKFRRDAPRILIGSVVLVVAALSFFSNRLFSGLTGAVEDKQFHLIETILTSNLQAAQDKALARAEMLARMPEIQASLAARDRAKLLADCAPMFAVQQEKYGVDQVQFHIPPAISFLRLHAPEKFGDDLSTFRPMVASVNQDHVTRKGLVIASSGPAVFGVAPIQDPSGGSYVGSVDVGLDFGAILDALKASYQLDLALFIEEDPLQEIQSRRWRPGTAYAGQPARQAPQAALHPVGSDENSGRRRRSENGGNPILHPRDLRVDLWRRPPALEKSGGRASRRARGGPGFQRFPGGFRPLGHPANLAGRLRHRPAGGSDPDRAARLCHPAAAMLNERFASLVEEASRPRSTPRNLGAREVRDPGGNV